VARIYLPDDGGEAPFAPSALLTAFFTNLWQGFPGSQEIKSMRTMVRLIRRLTKAMMISTSLLLLILFWSPIPALCQQNALPDEPSSQVPEANSKLSGTAKSRSENHIFWVIPNYRSDEKQSATTLTSGAKVKIALQDSFDPAAFLVAGVFAGMSMAQKQYAPFGQGALGFAKYYGGAFADQAIGNIMTEALFPIALHQDPRYFVKGRGGFWKRTGYSRR